jgi:hypothetical protein
LFAVATRMAGSELLAQLVGPGLAAPSARMRSFPPPKRHRAPALHHYGKCLIGCLTVQRLREAGEIAEARLTTRIVRVLMS